MAIRLCLPIYYSQIEIVGEAKPQQLDIKREYGTAALRTFNVQLTRVYADNEQAPRTSQYVARAGFRDDDNTRDDLPVVAHSDALGTTSVPKGTATYHYFANPVKAGFPVVNVGPKLHGGTIHLAEMADDKLAVTKAVAETLGIGLNPDESGVTEFNATGYSRGVLLGILAVDRAHLQDMHISYLQGTAPGPRNKETKRAIAQRVMRGLTGEFKTIARHAREDPLHAVRNRAVIPLFSAVQLASYWGDASALHGGEAGEALTRISRALRGHMIVFGDDSLGLPGDYEVDFPDGTEAEIVHIRPFSDFQMILHPGTHTSGITREMVIFDRDAWAAEAERRANSA